MSDNNVVIKFNKVSFEYGHNNPILDEVDFALRRGAKFTLMGQNGAGKSTIFQLIVGGLKPEDGTISIDRKLSIAISRQVVERDQMELTVREFFEKSFSEKIYDIDPKIDKILEVINLVAPKDRIIKSFSGGQQARLLLASALVQDPDILLLDEPTNNLDKSGIEHLTQFLKNYKKTVIVISHDARFLNSFTQGVLYLDAHTRKLQQFNGDYFDVVKEISAQIEKENRKNAQYKKQIIANKEKANFFANKGGRMRLLAKKMREKASDMEDAKVDVRKEDRTIRPFEIPFQDDLTGEILNISSFSVMKGHELIKKKAKVCLRKNNHLLISGPNGIGKSTLIEALATGKADGAKIADRVEIGYYRQDFSTLNFEDTVYQSLLSVMNKKDEEMLRSAASGFLITKEMIYSKIGTLSEGQKGLVAFCRLMLQKPGLLILDEPTNHINFRHLPIIASALSKYQGAMILVSHVSDFINQIKIDEVLDLEK
jgi:ATPase subunit of ABC transporter with duplicated ATPase domains